MKLYETNLRSCVKVFLICISLFSFIKSAYSQQRKVEGYVMANGKPLPNATLKLNFGDTTLFALTNNAGLFKTNPITTGSQFVIVSVSMVGYKHLDTLLETKKITNLKFSLIDSIPSLESVTIHSNKISEHANRLIYHIDPKKFVKNTTAPEAIKGIPDLIVINDELKYANRKNVIIYINNIESSYRDLKSLKIEEINFVEVVPNAPSIYEGDAPVSIVKVFTKDINNRFLNGDLALIKGVRLKQFGFDPSLSLKFSKVTFKTEVSYLTNNQNIEQNVRQIYKDDTSKQYSTRKVNGWQLYSHSLLGVEFNSRSNLVISSTSFNYNFKGKQMGHLSTGKNITQSQNLLFNVLDTESLAKWNVAANFSYKINKQSKILIKSKYLNYKTENGSLYQDENDSVKPFTTVITKTKEISNEVIYNLTKLNNNLKYKLNDLSLGVKNIYRQYQFQTNNFNFNQFITSAYFDANISVTPQLSSNLNLLGEITNNKGEKIDQSYCNFLPSLTIMYKLNDKTNMDMAYSRRITRPGGNYINPNSIFYSPTYILMGNAKLRPQIRNNYEINLKSTINKNSTLNCHLYYEKGKNFIAEAFSRINNQTITTYNNLGGYNSVGESVGITTKIFKKISINLSTGLSYNHYSNMQDSSLIVDNKGLSVITNLYAYMKINKFLSTSIYGYYTSPSYTLNSKSKSHPYTGLNLSSSFLKDKMHLSIDYTDLFGLNKHTKTSSKGLNFNQIVNTVNNTSNITFTLTYNFGKLFDYKLRDNSIINNDIILK